jgi:hypothetical protein
MGYSHIPQQFATPINAFYHETFNPWLNLHRPCLFATSVTNTKGKIVKRYRHKDVKTPLECLTQLSANNMVTFKPGISLAALQRQASSQTDLAAAQTMQRAKSEMFARFAKPKRRA